MPGYISEVDYDGGAASNFVEVVVPSSIAASAYSIVVYDKNGRVVATFALGSPVSTVGAKNVFLIDNNDANWVDVHNNDAIALVDNAGSVQQFVAFKDPVTAVEGPASGMSATQIGQHSGSNKSLITLDGGNTYSPTPTSSPGTVPAGTPPCFAPGTLIATPDGLRPVEALVPGDTVVTLDHGPQMIRWTRNGPQPLQDVPDDRKPVLIEAGALGPGLPNNDLIVSPQHRVLVGGYGQLERLFEFDALVPAKSLVSLRGVRHMTGKRKINWIHFACDRHEVVMANGCLSESLLVGPMVMHALTVEERVALTDIFGIAPSPEAALNGPPARRCLTVAAARRRIENWDETMRPGTKIPQLDDFIPALKVA